MYCILFSVFQLHCYSLFHFLLIFNSPQTEISNEIKNYTNLVNKKIEDLPNKVNYNLKFRNNLNKKMTATLERLNILLKQNKIAILKSDNDDNL